MRNRNDFSKPAGPDRARYGFYIHLTAFLAVNALLVCVNLLTTPGRLWFYWPLLGWGIGLLAHGGATFALPLLRSPPQVAGPALTAEGVDQGGTA